MANWFIGLPVAAQQLPEDVFDSLPAGLLRFAATDLHITVAFLGGVEASAARAAWAAARLETGPFNVTVGGPAALGHPRRPTAFGLDVAEGHETVVAMIERWQNPLRVAAGLAEETRPVRPHITLARAPRRGGDTVRSRARQWVNTYEPPTCHLDLDTVALYTWSDDRRTRRFKIVEAARLPCA